MAPTTSPSGPDVGAIEESWRALARVHRRVGDHVETRLRSRHGLSLNEFRVLRRLADAADGRLRMARIAEGVGLTPSAASRLVARLEESRGLVGRCHCDHDRRGVYTQITDEGERLLEDAGETYGDALRSAWREAGETGELEGVRQALAAYLRGRGDRPD